MQQAALDLLRRGRGDLPLHQPRGPVEENTGRSARRIAHHAAAGRILRRSVDVRQFHGFPIDPDRVTIHAGQRHGVVRRGRRNQIGAGNCLVAQRF